MVAVSWPTILLKFPELSGTIGPREPAPWRRRTSMRPTTVWPSWSQSRHFRELQDISEHGRKCRGDLYGPLDRTTTSAKSSAAEVCKQLVDAAICLI
jgi:hypothetical protein